MKRFILSVGLVLMALPALAQDHHSGAAQENRAAMQKMHKVMMEKMSGDADKDFVTMMIPHHQGAIDMARVELKYGKDPELRAMAEKIIRAQEEEIAHMKKWQAAH